jgi:DegV family protein with EDD domain
MSIGQGFLAIAAAEALANGASLDEAGQLVEGMVANLYTFASLSTLKYVAMSGRVGRFVAGITSVFDIRPMLTMKNGTLQMIDRIRSHDAAIEKLASSLCNSVAGKKIERAAIYHINDLEDAHLLESMLREKLPLPTEILTVAFTPGLSVHAGNEMVGATFYAR